MSEEPVGIAVVANETEADVACGLLRTEGIRCGHRLTNVGGGLAESVGSFGPREVYMRSADVERARALLAERAA